MPPVKRSRQIKPTSNAQTEQTLALLEILALGDRQIAAGRVQPAAEIIARLRERRPTG